jgi:tetratricopeptide (TPR) repeat protein
MQTAAINSLFLTGFSSYFRLVKLTKSFSHEFYQQFSEGLIKGLYRQQESKALGDRLVALADHAYCLRQMETVEHIAGLLSALPLGREFEAAASYYKALCLQRQKRFSEARHLLEQVACNGPFSFRAKAMVSIGATYCLLGDYDSSVPLYAEAARAAFDKDAYDLTTIIQVQRMVSVVQSIDGNHHGAINGLEKISPLIQVISRWQPYLYFEHLNSLAVELSEVGRVEEAKRASEITLASPYASAYPEWRETYHDILLRGQRASRSVVSFSQKQLDVNNVLRLPQAEHGDSLKLASGPARVLNYSEWKKKMVKEPNGDEQNIENMSDKDIFLEIMHLTSQDDITRKQLEKILEAVKKITAKPDKS